MNNDVSERFSRLDERINNLTRSIERLIPGQIESQHHLLSELPQNDFREVDLTSGIFSLREENSNSTRSNKSKKTSHKKNEKKSRWKFWSS